MHKFDKAAAGPDIPVFKLYGEAGDWQNLDLLHCESIAERSRQHDWKIKAHRHAELAQILYLKSGAALVTVDDADHVLVPPCIQYTAKMCVHGFEFSSDVDGLVVSLSTALLDQLGAWLGPCRDMLGHTSWFTLGDERELVDLLFARLASEYRGGLPGRELLLESTLKSLLALFSRRFEAHGDGELVALDRSARHFADFTALVEQHYGSHWSIEAYAAQLGISSAHLNSLCQRFSGHSALQIVHKRLLLEAKRNLIYTAMTVAEIADRLGFVDPGYFSRFFHRLAGMSPRDFRGSCHSARP